jgi:hypothetical protein
MYKLTYYFLFLQIFKLLFSVFLIYFFFKPDYKGVSGCFCFVFSTFFSTNSKYLMLSNLFFLGKSFLKTALLLFKMLSKLQISFKNKLIFSISLVIQSIPSQRCTGSILSQLPKQFPILYSL